MKNLLILCCLAIIFFACEKDEVTPDEPAISQTDAATFAGQVSDLMTGQAALQRGYEQADTQASQEDDLNDGFRGSEPVGDPDSFNNCPLVNFSADPETFFPAVLTLDYTEDCEDPLLAGLDGLITATFNGFLLTEGATFGLVYDAFTVNDYALSGNYLVTNTGLDQQGRQSSSHLISDVAFSEAGTPLFTYAQTGQSYQTEGQSTNFFNAGLSGIFDDVFNDEISGGGDYPSGASFTIESQDPLVRKVGCRHYVAGSVAYTISSFPLPATVNYGNGNCDNQATVTIGEFSFPVTL